MQTVWLLSSIIEREEGWEEKGISTKGADSGQEEWEEDVEGKEKRENRNIFLPILFLPTLNQHYSLVNDQNMVTVTGAP